MPSKVLDTKVCKPEWPTNFWHLAQLRGENQDRAAPRTQAIWTLSINMRPSKPFGIILSLWEQCDYFPGHSPCGSKHSYEWLDERCILFDHGIQNMIGFVVNQLQCKIHTAVNSYISCCLPWWFFYYWYILKNSTNLISEERVYNRMW